MSAAFEPETPPPITSTLAVFRRDGFGDVRGHGMLVGLELVTDRESRTRATEETKRILELMRQNQVLVGKEGRFNNVLKLRPPLILHRKHVDQFVAALDASLSALD
ncbi:MAG: aminotransferase class III-fold pyridoxal phosphate-dependent enzyme [Chromatiales bacterium]|nr:MAG: aminotransferase class III-fold pyridoxal phosphate-dependent enzyme [Chromatiales bacterium]